MPPFDPAVHLRRRADLVQAMKLQGGGVMLLPAAEEKLRNADSEYIFRQDSDHAWVTGFDEPEGCALVFADGRYVLFVRPRDREREIWTGRRAGVEGAREVYGATEAFPVAELDAKLPTLLDGAGTIWYRLGHDAAWDARVARALQTLRARARRGATPPTRLIDSGVALHELRLVKRPEELDALRKAAALTVDGHLAAMREGRAGRHEYELQAEIEYRFRKAGGGSPGYGTIVATGANATVLHYRAGDDVLRDGQLCLVDAGGEWGWHTADITRTWPVSGRFSPAQRSVYEAVLEAEVAGIEAVKPGATIDGIHALVVHKLTEAMIRLGLLKGSAEERIADKGYEKYYMHRTSHWLGMDVHDVGTYLVDGKPRLLQPGMVLTMEPGLYIPATDPDAPDALRGIGVRIEDDVLVTADGHEDLTAAMPKGVAEVEATCRR